MKEGAAPYEAGNFPRGPGEDGDWIDLYQAVSDDPDWAAQKIRKLKQALEFYATQSWDNGRVHYGNGHIARVALRDERELDYLLEKAKRERGIRG